MRGTASYQHWQATQTRALAGSALSPAAKSPTPSPEAIRLPTSATPDVSVIIPVYGSSADSTLRCLDAIGRHAPTTRIEVIRRGRRLGSVGDGRIHRRERAAAPAQRGQLRVHHLLQQRGEGGPQPLPALPEQRHRGAARLVRPDARHLRRRARRGHRRRAVAVSGRHAPGGRRHLLAGRSAWNYGKGDDPARPDDLRTAGRWTTSPARR